MVNTQTRRSPVTFAETRPGVGFLGRLAAGAGAGAGSRPEASSLKTPMDQGSAPDLIVLYSLTSHQIPLTWPQH